MGFLKGFFTFVGGLTIFLIVIGITVGASDVSQQTGSNGINNAGISSDELTENETEHPGGFICTHPRTPPSGAFTAGDLPNISQASSGNEARFDRDYRYRKFFDCMLFDSLERDIFGDGWDLRLKVSPSSWLADATCSIPSGVANQLVDVSENQAIHVEGQITTTAIGTVLLENCRVHY